MVEISVAGIARPAPGPDVRLGERLYTPSHEVDALQQSQRDERLMREVVQFAQPPRDLLTRLSAQPLVLARQVATPNYEFLHFLKRAEQLGRPPLVLEWSHDWFTPSINATKRALGRLPIHVGTDRQGQPRIHGRKIVSFEDPGRQRFSDLRCFDGTPFVAFHHDLVRAVAGDAVLSRAMDGTAFYADNAPRSHYERLFALYTCFGACADTFPLSGPEQSFTETVVLPAFESIVRRFGATPAIVRLLPAGSEMDHHWECYPPEVAPFARKAATA